MLTMLGISDVNVAHVVHRKPIGNAAAAAAAARNMNGFDRQQVYDKYCHKTMESPLLC